MKFMGFSGLFINCVEANDSIYESGKMAFDCLKGSKKYSLDYIEITPENAIVSANYDFFLFNYHFATMHWLNTKLIRERLPGVKITLVLEMAPNDPFVYCSPDDFDAYIVLDPTVNIERRNVYPFPRPLETLQQDVVYEPKDVPVIGSFGFATIGKGFEHVVDAVNREFDKAVVRINVPYGTYTDASGILAMKIEKMCKDRAKDGVEVVITHDYMTKSELIKWCGENTLNCFLYDRNLPGLAATTDQAITSGRPLIISKNNTFRHIQKFIKPFPYQTLKDAIKNTQKSVEDIQREWSPEKFRERFEKILDDFNFDAAKPKSANTVELPVIQINFIQKLKNKVAVRTRLKRMSKFVQLNHNKDKKTQPERSVSYSEFGEDIIVNDLLNKLSLQNITYLDIGSNRDECFSTTFLFYKRGLIGVLTETNFAICEKMKENRAGATILNVGIETSGNKQELNNEPNLRLLRINELISTYFTECPDLVSLNTKGCELPILETLDFEKYNPAVFCIGTLAYKNDGSACRNHSIYDFLDSKGYFPYKETHANTIFLNKNLYEFYLYQQNVKRSENIEGKFS